MLPDFTDSFSRKAFLKSLVIGAATAAMPMRLEAATQNRTTSLSLDDLKAFQKVAGLDFADDDLRDVLAAVNDHLAGFAAVRTEPIDERTLPATLFAPHSMRQLSSSPGVSVNVERVRDLTKPSKDEDLAFLSVRELGHLIATRQVSSQELTALSIRRLEAYGDKLLCLVTLLKDQALEQAKRRDAELAAGHSRGPLHGIPCGLKDLFALKGAPTTWGAAPFKDRVLDYDSAVAERLQNAGAVIVAKLSMGALAMGDVWFKGMTRNPWDPTQGSSGSSAGSASSTAAGLVPFAIGTETLGSICSPSFVCRVTGLRPTFGRVSRYGAMELSYTMDKIGPICRHVEDCALVFSAIAGGDARDPSSVDRPFHYRTPRDLHGFKIGHIQLSSTAVPNADMESALKVLSGLGAQIVPVKISPTPPGIIGVLDVEAGSAFDAFTRGSEIDELKDSAWPSIFRASRFVPAVEYLQMMRARTLLAENFERELGDLDCVAALGTGGMLLEITNLTGHPQVLVPNGVNEFGRSKSVSFVGRLYEEDRLLAIAHLFQKQAGFDRLRPTLGLS